jgi:hypothetical protein
MIIYKSRIHAYFPKYWYIDINTTMTKEPTHLATL